MPFRATCLQGSGFLLLLNLLGYQVSVGDLLQDFSPLLTSFPSTPKGLTRNQSTEGPSLPRPSSSQPLCVLTSWHRTLRRSLQEPLWLTRDLRHVPVILLSHRCPGPSQLMMAGPAPHCQFSECPPSPARRATTGNERCPRKVFSQRQREPMRSLFNMQRKWVAAKFIAHIHYVREASIFL